MSKSKTLQVRLTPLNMAKLDALAKDNGVSRSEMLRRILEEVVTVGKVNWDTGHVKIIQADGEVIPVDQSPEELAARE